MSKEEEKPVVEEKKKKVSKGKKPHKNKLTSKKYTKYEVKGTGVSRGLACPRCGAGVFLAVHKGRLHCGKCNYTEFK
jgi:small subunit ribosomal protein S27Ae